MRTDLPLQIAELQLPTRVAAAFVRRSPDTLRLARRTKAKGHMPPHVKVSPRRVLYRVADLLHWLDQRGERPNWRALPARVPMPIDDGSP